MISYHIGDEYEPNKYRRFQAKRDFLRLPFVVRHDIQHHASFGPIEDTVGNGPSIATPIRTKSLRCASVRPPMPHMGAGCSMANVWQQFIRNVIRCQSSTTISLWILATSLTIATGTYDPRPSAHHPGHFDHAGDQPRQMRGSAPILQAVKKRRRRAPPSASGRLREDGSLTRKPLTSGQCSPSHRPALI